MGSSQSIDPAQAAESVFLGVETQTDRLCTYSKQNCEVHQTSIHQGIVYPKDKFQKGSEPHSYCNGKSSQGGVLLLPSSEIDRLIGFCQKEDTSIHYWITQCGASAVLWLPGICETHTPQKCYEVFTCNRRGSTEHSRCFLVFWTDSWARWPVSYDFQGEQGLLCSADSPRSLGSIQHGFKKITPPPQDKFKRRST